MKESRWAVSIITFGLGLFVLCLNFASAGIVIDDFNNTRSYPTCCGEYGTYWAFDSNVVQNGSGTLVVGGTASDNGGFYRDKQGEVLWNFTAQSNLVLRAKVLAGNQATNFYLVFRDATGNRALYTFPFSELNSSNFTVLSKSLFTPDWTDGAPFDFTRVISMDIYGEFTEVDSPLRLELDSIETQGPSVIGMLHMDYRTTNGVLVLSWSTNLTNGFLLQSSPTVLGGWGNENNIVVVSNEYRFAVLMTNETRFYRLLATSDSLGEYPVMDEEEFWASLPSPDSLIMRNEANLAVADEPVLTDFPMLPPMPPLPPMPDERLGLTANRAMLSEMQATTMNSGTPPPPTGTVVPTNSYIDVSAYSVVITNLYFDLFGTTNPADSEKTYSLSYSSHTGGAEYYQEMYYTSHVAVLTNSFPWVRTGGYLHQNCTTIWDPASSIWTNGAQVYAQGSASSTNIVSPPSVLLGKLAGLYNSEGYGDINPGSEYGFLESMYRRQDVQLELHVGRAFSNNWRTFVLLSNTAARVDSIAIPEWDDWYESLLETDIIQSAPISFSNITVLGQGLNIDNSLFVQLVPGTITNVTPAVTGASNYTFNIEVVRHKVVPLTYVYHHFFHFTTNKVPRLSDLQGYFNAGSLTLAQDNDAKIPDSDTNVAYSTYWKSPYRNDDVPVYVEFQISDGPTNECIFTHTALPIFHHAGTNRSVAYFNVKRDRDLDAVLAYTNANIKLIKSIDLAGGSAGGKGSTNQNSIVLAEIGGFNNETPVHEWGHVCGLWHRQKADTNGVVWNPGNVTNAVMAVKEGYVGPRVTINRFERDTINSYLNSHYP